MNKSLCVIRKYLPLMIIKKYPTLIVIKKLQKYTVNICPIWIRKNF